MGFVTFALIIVGAILGAALGNDQFSILAGGAIGFLVGLVRSLQNRLTNIESKIEKLSKYANLENFANRAAQEGSEKPKGGAKKTEDVPDRALSKSSIDKNLAAEKSTRSSAAKAAATASYETSQQSGQPAPEWFQTIRQYIAGANTAVLAGIVILFIGIVFLLKYAIEHSLLPVELRLTSSFIVGALLVGLGWRLKEKKEGYSLIMQGGGVGILYLTIFVSFRIYELIPQSLAFVFLVIVIILGMFLSAAQKSRAMAVLSTAGGFMAPILTSTGEGNYVALFSYYLILNSGILAVAYYRAWRILNLMGFLFTFGVGAMWGSKSYQSEYFLNCQIFLNAFFLIFAFISVLYAIRKRANLRSYIDSTLVFGLPLTYFAMQFFMFETGEQVFYLDNEEGALPLYLRYGLSLVSIYMGTLYLAVAYFLMGKFKESLKDMIDAFLSLGIIFANMAIPLAFEAPATSALWAFEGAALIWVGMRQGRFSLRVFGFLLQLSSWWVFTEQVEDNWETFFNGQFFGFLIIVVSALFSGWMVRKRYGQNLDEAPDEKDWIVHLDIISHSLYIIAFYLFWLMMGFFQIETLIEEGKVELNVNLLYLGLSVFGAVLGGQKLKWRQLSHIQYIFAPLLLLAAWLQLAIFNGDFFDHGGWLTWPSLLALFYFVLRAQKEEEGRYFKFNHFVLWALLYCITAVEAYNRLNGESLYGTVWPNIVFPMFSALPLFALNFPRFRAIFSFGRLDDFYKWVVLGVFALITLGGLLVTNIGHNGSGYPLTYIPLLNPLDLASVIGLAIVLQWYLTLGGLNGGAKIDFYSAGIVFFGMLGVVFVFINMAIARIAHHLFGVYWSFEIMYETLGVQMTYTIFWGVAGLCFTVAGNALKRRQIWIAGAVFLAMVVAKLFFIDLSSTQTTLRIVTFVAVGILLLVVGYFAPVPPDLKKSTIKEGKNGE